METMGYYEDLVEGMKACIGEGKKFSTNADMARYCGVQAVQTSRYMNGEREKHLKALGNILDKIGAKLVWDHDQKNIPSQNFKSQEYIKKIQELEKEIEELKRYKAKWEGHLEELAVREKARPAPKLKESKFSSQDTA